MGQLDLRAKTHSSVAREGRGLARFPKRRRALVELTADPLRDAQLAEKTNALPALGREERDRATEQVDRGRGVGTLPGPDPCRAQPLSRPLRQFGQTRIARSQLGTESVCLLEVVADDLLGPFLALFEPGCETLVELTPRLFRDSRVGDVTDKDVVEPEGVLRLAARTRGMEQASPYERLQPTVCGHNLIRRSQVHDRGAREFPARNGSPLEHGSFLWVEPIEAAREQRFHGRGNRLESLRSRFLVESQQLLDEEWIPLGDVRDARSRLGPDSCAGELPDERVGFCSSERLQPENVTVGAQAGPLVTQLRARKAEDEQRRFDGPRGEVLDEVEQGRLCPMQVFEHEDQWKPASERLEQPPGGPEQLPGWSGALDLAGELGHALSDQRR
jgi:hypothetical protein